MMNPALLNVAWQVAGTLGGVLFGYGIAMPGRTGAVSAANRSEAAPQSALREAEALASRQSVEAARAQQVPRDRLAEADDGLLRAEARHEGERDALRAELARTQQALAARTDERDRLRDALPLVVEARGRARAERDAALADLATLQARWDRAFKRERGPDGRIVAWAAPVDAAAAMPPGLPQDAQDGVAGASGSGSGPKAAYPAQAPEIDLPAPLRALSRDRVGVAGDRSAMQQGVG